MVRKGKAGRKARVEEGGTRKESEEKILFD